MVVPAFCLSAVQTVFVCAWTYKQLIQEWGQLGGLIKHGFVSAEPDDVESIRRLTQNASHAR